MTLDRVAAGVAIEANSFPAHRNSLDDLPENSDSLRFCRVRNSHRGISRFRNLRRLWLFGVNQEFLEELAEIDSIEFLYVDGLTASDLSPLKRLKRLQNLVLIGGTKIQTLDWVAGLPPLKALLLENFKHVSRLDPLESLVTLTALGIEGSIWTSMRVESLAPISKLTGLHYAFFTNLRTADNSLRPLQSLKHLDVLECGALFPDEEFVTLRQALPKLRCSWFNMIDSHGSTREGIQAAVKKIL